MIQEFKNKVITVLCGGNSQERDVSLRSGHNVYEALIRLGYQAEIRDPIDINFNTDQFDVVFLALHGPGYEDGTIQSQLELHTIPYTGCGVLASQIGMDKSKTKLICSQNNLPIPQYMLLHSVLDTLPSSFAFPVILKPVSEGSSIDVFIIETLKELHEKSTYLTQLYRSFIIEEFIEGRELTVGLVESPDLIALPILELKTKNRFYDYEAKYTKGLTSFILPASLSDQDNQVLFNYSKQLFLLASCSGFARIDFRFCPKRGPFILEINTIPGLTDTSDIPAQAKEFGWSFDTFISNILLSALNRHLLWVK
ncbi:D-alanine--D-alanine ligase [bacterium]|nr:D-alanine--D-alanine ligase [bacterium]|tara:strand:+ start:4785 stop:5717 length:933 start_codon:yes stop_codon:yes gene_type:complete